MGNQSSFPTPSDQDSEYLGWINGKNKKSLKVEIIFDFMCPGCKDHLEKIPVGDSGQEQNIFEYLQGFQVEGEEMSYLDAI